MRCRSVLERPFESAEHYALTVGISAVPRIDKAFSEMATEFIIQIDQ